MSDLQGRRIPGEEENSGRRRPILWIVLGLVLLLLLALLIPFACQSLTGSSGQPSDGSGAQGDAQDDRNVDESQKDAGAQNDGTGNAGAQVGGDGAAEQSESGAPGDPEGGSQGASVTRLDVRDQGGNGATVAVPAATVEGTKGWLAVRADDGGKPGRVLGHAALQAGANEDVKVELDRPVGSSQRLYATVHAERPADGDFTYPGGDPTLERSGGAAAEPITYTVNDAASSEDRAGGTAGKAAGGGIQDDELPESGGIPPAALLWAASVLLMSVAAGFSLASRRGGANGS